MAGSLEANKIVAGVLTAGVAFVGAGVMSDLLYHPGTIEENAFPIAVETDDATAVADADAPALEPLAVRLASASAEDGEAGFRACAACHTVDSGGANRVGPNLWGVLGREVGGKDGFNYSDALAGHGGAWTYEDLYAFLESPNGWAPGTSMSFAGMRDPEDRVNMVAYLRSLADDPLPLPEAEATEPAADEPADAAPADGEDPAAVDEAQPGG